MVVPDAHHLVAHRQLREDFALFQRFVPLELEAGLADRRRELLRALRNARRQPSRGHTPGTNARKHGHGGKRREPHDIVRIRVAKPLPATSPDRPPQPHEPRGGSSPLIRIRPYAARASRTLSACVSGFTRRMAFLIRPFSSITKVERSTPQYFFPPKLFSFQTP
jgi:hypothetical protein